MAAQRYTIDELKQLRSSPLVKKPDRLPPIEQWLDESQQNPAASDRTARTAASRVPRSTVTGDKSPMGNFSTGQRPSLLHTRTAGSRSGDDFLTATKPGFTSSRSISRLTSFGGDTNTSDAVQDDQDRSRALGDRQHTRKNTSTFDRENWSTVRERRALGDSEHSRNDSNGERSTRQGQRDGDKQESRWPPRDDRRDDRRQNGERPAGGWRERERENGRRDRGWNPNEQNEREPEWFEGSTNAKQDEDLSGLSQAHTQEDFQKWKDMMNANKKPQEDPKPEEPLHVSEPPKQIETLKIDTIADRPFGSLVTAKSPEPASMQNKGKASRFASMFKKEDSITSPAPEQQNQPPPPPASAPPASMMPESREDKEGFQRILQMLGGTNIGGGMMPAAPEPRSPPRSGTSGARQRSRFFDSAKSPELTAAVQAQPMPPAMSNMQSPVHDRSSSGFQNPAPAAEFNLQSMMANQRASRPAASNKDSEFLLGLLQSHSTRPNAQPTQPTKDFPLWLNQDADGNTRPTPGSGRPEDHLPRGPPQSAQPQMARPPPGFDDQARMMPPMPQRGPVEYNGLPPQHFDPAMAARRPPGMPPGMHHQPQQGGNDLLPFMQPPPPGLPPHLRHPQGFPNMQPPHFANGPPPQPPFLPQQQQQQHSAGAPPPGFGRGMPPQQGPPPGLPAMMGMHEPNGVYGRGAPQQPGVYDQRR